MVLPPAFRAAKLVCRGQFQRIRLAFFSTDIVGDKPILVRDYIRSALYDPDHGYFSKRSGPVGVLDSSIRFNQLQDRSAYIQHLDNLYKQHDIAWFTPVELFKPWYAYGIAEAIMRTANLSIPLKIFEIGGGSGTCAKCILDYMMLNAPAKVYNNMTYISIEISPSLAERQLETIGEVQSHLSRYKVECRDATERSGWGPADPQPCWVIMLEVLDNLPHDLVYSPNQVSPWMEVWLQKAQDSLQISEVYKPLQDQLITQCVKIIGMDKDHSGGQSRLTSASRHLWSKVFPKPRRAWMPTGCLQLMEVLHSALPKMSLIASDFSYLPDVSIPGDRAPLVSSKKHGSTVDHSNYLDAKRWKTTKMVIIPLSNRKSRHKENRPQAKVLDTVAGEGTATRAMFKSRTATYDCLYNKGDADIFFPTDFWLLERIDHHCSGWLNEPTNSKSLKPVKKRRIITLDTAAFMEEFGLPTKTRTKDGHNPLLDDFKNTKFYISVPTHNVA